MVGHRADEARAIGKGKIDGAMLRRWFAGAEFVESSHQSIDEAFGLGQFVLGQSAGWKEFSGTLTPQERLGIATGSAVSQEPIAQFPLVETFKGQDEVSSLSGARNAAGSDGGSDQPAGVA